MKADGEADFVRHFPDTYLCYRLQIFHVFIVRVLKHIVKFVVIGNVPNSIKLVFLLNSSIIFMYASSSCLECFHSQRSYC